MTVPVKKKDTRTKEEKFVDVAKLRTQSVVDALRRLGRVSNRNVYGYNRAQVNQMLNRIHIELAQLARSFEQPLGEFDFQGEPDLGFADGPSAVMPPELD